ncbi:MAG: polysaccharide deacetylase [Sporocytophaga sp.]|uniref:polysaccharide deacetylase n=1 Tax=Sporocytophaga sp. TaxID=2231183 RepID=UPI001B29FC56|nr:polysaccharide deacetylase [Sporocytophaga sp.]MBO9701466.1 polysaccharide deacetylase [Sporocytophaga sp.]
MVLKIFICLLLVSVCLSSVRYENSWPEKYQVYFAVYIDGLKSEKKLILRKFIRDRKEHFLIVDPNTLNTDIIAARKRFSQKITWEEVNSEFKNSPYIRLINSSINNSSNLQDAGITHVMPDQKGIDLTIDLCPSHRPLDKRIFTSIISEFEKFDHPVPLAISVSGLWMEKHHEDLEWLKGLVREKKITVEWINHSFHHRVNVNEPLKENFLLEKNTNISEEILDTEREMIEEGLIPSCMFRFPGLVSDKKLYEKVTAFGLLPIGTDAWLAKGQKAYNGSIVLIHGNGNEPVGVNDFLNLIKNEGSKVKAGDWLLFDLRQSLTNEMR